jgi:hypothetical protein
MQIGKVVLFLVVSVAISGVIGYHNKISEVKQEIEKYKELDDFYSSYGFNSDEYDKMSNNDVLYLQQAKKVRQMYRDNMDNAYIMQDCVLTALDDGMDEEEFYGTTLENVFSSYERNYIIVNQNYLKEYVSCKIISGNINPDLYTIFVPDMYQKDEKVLREHYKLVLEDKILVDNYYGDKVDVTIAEDDINIVYVDSDYSVKLLSDYQYDSQMDIEIPHPVMILDTGDFASGIYMDMLSNCQMAYKEENKSDFSAMLERYGLEQLFSARTMLAPFMEDISSYQFLLRQSGLFIGLFSITLLFFIYISNHVHMNVHAKDYGVKFQMGYHGLQILKSDIWVTGILLVCSFVLQLVGINIYGYLFFVLVDLMMMYISYRTNIVNQLYQIMNGGC